MKHLECADTLSVILDEPARVSDGGIILDKAEAIDYGKDHRAGTVYAAPEFYTIHRGKKEIRTRCPVRAGDRIIIERFGGVGTVVEDGKTLTLVRVHEIQGILEE